MLARHTQSYLLNSYLADFACLFGDVRSHSTFQAIMQGILSAGSLVCTRIATQAPSLNKVRHGSQRVVRFAGGDSTHRSSATASRLVDRVAQRGVASLEQTPCGTDVWLILDGSDLRKPHAKEMEDLMRVRSLQGTTVNGYRLSHHECAGGHSSTEGFAVEGFAVPSSFLKQRVSSKEQDHLSESHEVQSALTQVGTALKSIQAEHPTTWIMDSGFDDVAVWRTIWEQEQHLLCRVQHINRLVQYKSLAGQWCAGHLQDAVVHLRGQGRVQTSMVVRLKGQRYEKRQPVTVQLSSCPIQVSYEPDVRRVGPAKGDAAKVTQAMWLLKVEVLDSRMEPWYLLTDWPAHTPSQAARIFQMYRQRWSVEEAFQFLKMCVGWESVQVLELEAVRTLVALGWVAAGFLFCAYPHEIDGGWEWVDVELRVGSSRTRGASLARKSCCGAYNVCWTIWSLRLCSGSTRLPLVPSLQELLPFSALMLSASYDWMSDGTLILERVFGTCTGCFPSAKRVC